MRNFYFGKDRLNTTFWNYMAKIFDLWSRKGAFGEFQEEAVSAKGLKGELQVYQVVRKRLVVN